MRGRGELSATALMSHVGRPGAGTEKVEELLPGHCPQSQPGAGTSFLFPVTYRLHRLMVLGDFGDEFPERQRDSVPASEAPEYVHLQK